MKQCEDNHALCNIADYQRFDDVASNELKNPIFADELLNEGQYHIQISLEHISDDEEAKLIHYLSYLRNTFGIYFIWRDETFRCDDHDRNILRCMYVGKGDIEPRIRSHLSEKAELADQLLYVSAYPCENRVAKYLEQLFLDTWNFPLNDAENTGSEILFGFWEDEQLSSPDSLHHLADKINYQP